MLNKSLVELFKFRGRIRFMKTGESSNYINKSLVLGGMLGAELVSRCILDSKPVLLANKKLHLHHWIVGAFMGIAGIFTKKSKNDSIKIAGTCLSGLGIGIFLHDAKDFLECTRC